MGETEVATSIVVAPELHIGAMRGGSERLTMQLDAALRLPSVLALDGDVDIRYGLLRTDLERIGLPIGGNDTMIAEHALSLGATLVADDTREFGRVGGLPMENWLRA